MLLDWPGFLVNMDKTRRESDAYGLGLQFWRDEWDWRPKVFSCGNFLYPALTKLDITELQVFAIRDSFVVGDLYQ